VFLKEFYFLYLSFVIPSKEGTQHISTFFSYQEEQVKQGLQKLSEKIRKKFRKFSQKIRIFQINIVYYYK